VDNKGKHIMKQILAVLVLLCGMMANSYAADYNLLSQKQIVCLATNQFYEVNGTSEIDYQLVTSTVLTRASLTGKTPCQVIHEPNQFSWVGKRITAKDKEYIAKKHIPRVIETINLYADGLIPKVTNFHNKTIKPKWTRDSSFHVVKRTKAQTYYFKVE
jgi:Cell Wall Hydrolase